MTTRDHHDHPAPAALAAPAGARRGLPRWPLFLIAAPAAAAVWSGWVGLGGLCGFGPIRLLPGIFPELAVNTAITLPVGVEAYGAYAMWAWLAHRGSGKTQQWARNSAFGALALGCLGQVAFHLMAAAGMTRAPWYVTMLVACIPVATFGFAVSLTHMLHCDATARHADEPEPDAAREESVMPATPAPAMPAAMPALHAVPDASPDEAARQAWLASGRTLSPRKLAEAHGRSRMYWAPRIERWEAMA